MKIQNNEDMEIKKAVHTAEELYNAFVAYLAGMLEKKEQLDNAIQRDDRYLCTAEDMGRKPENIKKREDERKIRMEKRDGLKKKIQTAVDFARGRKLTVISRDGKDGGDACMKAFYSNAEMNLAFVPPEGFVAGTMDEMLERQASGGFHVFGENPFPENHL